jgi:hypothetical protein
VPPACATTWWHRRLACALVTRTPQTQPPGPPRAPSTPRHLFPKTNHAALSCGVALQLA